MDTMNLRGILKGHTNWVTSITSSSENPDMLLSASRDRSIMVWKLNHNEVEYGHAHRALLGHNHFVEDVVISSDGQFVLSASWDCTLRLWELATGNTTRRFIGHSKDVLSVAFSSDNRKVVSGSRDRTIKLWNTLGDCKHTIESSHNDWVSCIRFSPNASNPIFVSGGWDKKLKVWNLADCISTSTLEGHTGYINAVTVSPDGSICASGGKDGNAILWDLNEGSLLYSLSTGSMINTLCFSPKRYWLCTGTSSGIQIFDLESKTKIADLDHTFPDFKPKTSKTACISLSWSADGTILYAGYEDGAIRVWATNSGL